MPRRAVTEREAEPEAATSSPPQGEDEYYDDTDWLDALEREELESRIRDLAQDLTDLRKCFPPLSVQRGILQLEWRRTLSSLYLTFIISFLYICHFLFLLLLLVICIIN